MSTSTPLTAGVWSAVKNLPMVAVQAANLPDGRIIAWSSEDPYMFDNFASSTVYSVFDPGTQVGTPALKTFQGHDMFCPGLTQMPDGTVLVTGGITDFKVSSFDWRNDTWTVKPNTLYSRAYHSATLTSDDEVFVIGGAWVDRKGNKPAEVYNTATGWRPLTNVIANTTNIVGPDPEDNPATGQIYRGDNHTWMFAQSNGWIFHAGPSAQMNWINARGTGQIKSAGLRGDDPYAMNGSAVMYDIGKILKVGGAQAYGGAYASKAAYAIDITGGPSQNAAVTKLNPMSYARVFHFGTPLPNGQVVITGGQTYSSPFADTDAVLAAEIWDPGTRQFTVISKPMATPRNYHGVALLMADGRVWVSGSGLCGQSCGTNHLDYEILTPPYLLQADGKTLATRPVINSISTTAPTRGTTMTVNTDSTIVGFALMRLAGVTHTTNTDARRVPLTFVNNGSNSYTLSIPSDAGVLPSGYYFLFAMNANGVPSIARSVRVN